MTMTTSRLTNLRRAHAILRDAVAHLQPADLARPTPCTDWTVAQVLEHALIDQGIWANVVGDAPAPAGNAFAPTGALPDDLAAAVDTVLTGSATAWDRLPADTTSVPSPLSQGELDLATAVNAAALDAAVHAWDITTATGAAADPDDELAAELLITARELVEPLRQWGAYAAALQPTDGETSTDTLLRYLGRNPHWTPAS